MREEQRAKNAIVLDTNFIFEHSSNLEEVYGALSKEYSVFISDVSIKERISQKYMEIVEAYNAFNKLSEKYKKYISICENKSFEYWCKVNENNTIEAYIKLFGDDIIRLNPSEETWTEVMDRVYKKNPPFNKDRNASDKGLKDTLIWLSMIDFFAKRNFEKVIFITSDKIFSNTSEELINEFKLKTKTNISIQKASFYKDLIQEDEDIIKKDKVQEKGETFDNIELEERNIVKKMKIKEINELREKVSIAFNNVRSYECIDEFGGPFMAPYFISNTEFNVENMREILDNMKVILDNHLFELKIEPSKIFTELNVKDYAKIPLENLYKIVELYQYILKNFNEHIIQFFNAACSILNSNYQEKTVIDYNLPF